jgi:ATP-dependent helicase/nuclease subunit A
MTGNRAESSQRRASDPAQSVWLLANAGSGKTSVLIDRVARLLLRGTRPEKILCLTYTKAAAGEMQNRLFARLGEWSVLPDAELSAALERLDPDRGLAGPGALSAARRLFAEAIDAPGGLKIQTIHSFCAGLLRRFPVEAGVAPGFRELDEFQAAELRGMVAEELALGPDAGRLDAVVRRLDETKFDGFLSEVCRKRDAFLLGVEPKEIFSRFGLMPDASVQDACDIVFDGREDGVFNAVIPVFARGSDSMAKVADTLRSVAGGPRDEAALACVMACVLTQAGTPNKNILKSKAYKALGDTAEEFDAFMQRAVEARDLLNRLVSARATVDLHRFAQSYLPLYESAKATRGLIDFDDLIGRTGALLSNRSVAAWVLWRLDGGIDHVLVDEAQDTSPAQWDVIARLVEEIVAGDRATGRTGPLPRTMFVVGDEKQSIYSFQGADLSEFTAREKHFDRQLAAGTRLVKSTLATSFRSSAAVLTAVDLTFNREDISGLGARPPEHAAHHAQLPGRVDLWPVIPATEKPEPEDYGSAEPTRFAPSSEFVLADRIARSIRSQIDAGTQITLRDGTVRAIHEGDVLILVRRRGPLFSSIIRACKRQRLAVAGADRIKLRRELAVRDILALLSVLALPEDDLSLAAALRSPLIGLSEDQLFRLAQPRAKGSYLWAELRDRAAEYPKAAALLQDLRDRTDFLRPYELIERILVRHDGRRRLIARLGAEVEDGIDELLAQALIYEQTAVPSLTGFLGHILQNDIEVRREMSQASDALRVMTVHGAKGLEAPVVILPDTAATKAPEKDRVLADADGTPLWKGSAQSQPELVSAARNRAAEQVRDESMRLLYVAMTRAQSWLIVCGIQGSEPGLSWHDLVAEGVQKAGADTLEGPDGPFLRHSYSQWPAASDTRPRHGGGAPGGPRADASLPDWTQRPVTPTLNVVRPLQASGLPGPKVHAGSRDDISDGAASRLFGTRLHRLLEHLPHWPRTDWPQIAGVLLTQGDEPATEGETARALSAAATVLATPSLAWVFGPDTLAEVPVSGHVQVLGGRQAQAVIDRLIVGPDRVLAIDYKSNRDVPDRAEDVPLGILRQMGVTAELLAQIYPDRAVETAILWTASATLMPLPPDIVRSALQSTPIP